MATLTINANNIGKIGTLARGNTSSDTMAQDMLGLRVVDSLDAALAQGACLALRLVVPTSIKAEMDAMDAIIVSSDASIVDSDKALAMATKNALWLDVVANKERKDGLVYETHKYASKAFQVMDKNATSYVGTHLKVVGRVGQGEDEYAAYVIIAHVKGARRVMNGVKAPIAINSDGKARLEAIKAAMAKASTPTPTIAAQGKDKAKIA